jgi:hypothetical protein
MKILIIILISTTFSFAKSVEIQAKKLTFKYMGFDGGEILNCSHKEINEWGDFNVDCGRKNFAVHLKVSKYTRLVIPKVSFETLFWVTDRSDNYKGTGTTVWHHLNEETNLNSIVISQSTDNDTAGLYLTIQN